MTSQERYSEFEVTVTVTATVVETASVASPKVWEGPNIFDIKRATVFGVGHCFSKQKKRQDMLETWGA